MEIGFAFALMAAIPGLAFIWLVFDIERIRDGNAKLREDVRQARIDNEKARARCEALGIDTSGYKRL